MKVLFWTDGFWPRIGGIETQGLHLVQCMQKRGHEYLILSQRDSPSWKEEERHGNIQIRRLNFNCLIAERDPKAVRQIKESLDQILKSFQPDLIHLNATLGGSALAFLLFLRQFALPVVVTAHAPYVYEEKISPLVRQIINAGDQIGCVSNWVFQEMGRYFPEAKHKLRLIYNGLAKPNAAPLPLPFSPPVFLLFGRLVKEKGFEYAISAFALLKQRGSIARLIVAGGGPLRGSLEIQVKNLGLEPFVTFAGVLSQEELFAAFNRTTILLMPSLIESFGLVILEAMQMQRPVIASRVEGIPEVVLDGETGLLVPSRDPLALCEAMETLLNQPEKAIQMGQKGAERAMEFSIKRNADQFEQAYQEVCKMRS